MLWRFTREGSETALILTVAFLWVMARAASGVCAEEQEPQAASGQSAPSITRPLSFTRDVLPVLTKLGCNSGRCHGSFQGRGGFRLSLLGYDPPADYAALVSEGRGRRVFPAAPAMSLLLRKPTFQVPHGGGLRLAVDSVAYRVLYEWIAQGMPHPHLGSLTVTRLELNFHSATLKQGEERPLSVQAVWSDGVVTDATPWALFDTTDERVAAVDPSGTIRGMGPGRSAVTVRFMGQVAVATVSVPYQSRGGLAEWQQHWSPHNFIDELAAADWQQLGLSPAPLADDAEFMRRAYLDLIGTLPTPEEATAFLASADPGKRTRLVDTLLSRPEYVEYWSLKWGELLRGHRRYLGEKGLASFHGWLQQALRENRPADEMVRQLLTAQGNLYTNGAAAFYFVDQDAEDLAETTAQVFLGVRLQCARCHHHPFEVWGQDDHRSLAAFFRYVRRKDTKEGGRFGGVQAVSSEPAPLPLVAQDVGGKSLLLGKLLESLGPTGTAPEIGMAERGASAAAPSAHAGPPAAAGGPSVPQAEQKATPDVRVPLARWITSPDNPCFARNIVNRYWGYVFGRGLFEPVDDQRATNPPLNPALLDALAADFVRHGYDLKHLLRTICTSRVYQLASQVGPQADAQGRFLTHRVPRPLEAEVLLDAINQAAGCTERFENLPPGTRSIALADSAVPSEFLDTFGRPPRTTTCVCQRKQEPDLRRALLLANSIYVHQKVTDTAGRVHALCQSGMSDRNIVEQLYLAALTRLPTPEELERSLAFVAEAPARQQGFEDLLWALINCSEFSFSH